MPLNLASYSAAKITGYERRQRSASRQRALETHQDSATAATADRCATRSLGFDIVADTTFWALWFVETFQRLTGTRICPPARSLHLGVVVLLMWPCYMSSSSNGPGSCGF